jgi:hypothetical protein
MNERSRRVLRIQIERTSFDFVLEATSDTGVAKVTGAGVMEDLSGVREIGAVELTIWGSTAEQLRSRAPNWPARFDTIPEGHFGVSAAEEHRFDVFVEAPRFVAVLNLLQAAHGGRIVIHAVAAPDGAHDHVSRVEISGARE